MGNIRQILNDNTHRSFAMPAGNWSYYQEWNNALFLHWKVPYEALRKLVPQKLKVDTFEGIAYVSIVAFTMQEIRPRSLPAISFISDFDEINVRTYIDNNNKKGVYFLNIEAGKDLSVFIAKSLSGLPYERSNILRTAKNFKSNNTLKNFHLDVEFEVGEEITEKSKLDHWLTERYCLYLDKGQTNYCYDVHHKEWELHSVKLNSLKLQYIFGDINLTAPPDRVHYSKGVKVLAWGKQRLPA